MIQDCTIWNTMFKYISNYRIMVGLTVELLTFTHWGQNIAWDSSQYASHEIHSTHLNQYCMMKSSNGNIFHVTGPLCGEFTGPGEFPQHKGQWRGALMFTLICVWINGWVNNHEAGDLRRYRVHYDIIVMMKFTALTWTITDPVHWHIYAALGGMSYGKFVCIVHRLVHFWVNGALLSRVYCCTEVWKIKQLLYSEHNGKHCFLD